MHDVPESSNHLTAADSSSNFVLLPPNGEFLESLLAYRYCSLKWPSVAFRSNLSLGNCPHSRSSPPNVCVLGHRKQARTDLSRSRYKRFAFLPGFCAGDPSVRGACRGSGIGLECEWQRWGGTQPPPRTRRCRECTCTAENNRGMIALIGEGVENVFGITCSML
uniref:Uncharacterized protein n=1 Tax=Cacopsylla melanoneura TaxID=428564 RepID=A0A8D8X5C9_9HEMI